MNPIHNPFSRDEHPDLTAAINGVVNGQPRPVEEDIQTPARERQMKRKMKAAEHGSDAASSRYIQAWDAEAKSPDTNPKAAKALRAAGERFNAAVKKRNALYTTQRKEGSSKKTYGVGGKVVRESASPQGGDKKPFNPFNPTLGDLLRSKQQDKKAPKGKPVKEAVTPAQQKVFARERERMLNALNNPKQKLSPTEREAVLARGARNAAAETRKGAVSPTGEKSPIHSAAKAHHEYARRESKKLDAIAKRKVQEGAQLDERIIDEVDFFQASKNLLTGKGFKTNREVSGARVNANMAAMQRRKARAAKTAKKTK